MDNMSQERDCTSAPDLDDNENHFCPSEEASTMSPHQIATHQVELVSGKELDSIVEGEPPSYPRRQTGRHDSPDSYLPPADMRNSLEMFTANSDSSDILETVESRVKESVLSNGSKFKETAMVIESKTYRIQCDNSPDKFTIQLVNDAAVSPCYLRLKSTNDGDYKMETSCGGLPDPEVNGLDPKYLFQWIPKTHGAFLLKVMTCFIVLDTCTSPPRSLKVVFDEPSPDHYDASLIHREGANERWVLYFKYKNMVYVIKPENGGLAVEGHNKPVHHYLWKITSPP